MLSGDTCKDWRLTESEMDTLKVLSDELVTSPDAKTRLLAYVNAPGSATWDRLFSYMLKSNRAPTFWQLWTAQDSAAPTKHACDKTWESVPAPRLLLLGMMTLFLNGDI